MFLQGDHFFGHICHSRKAKIAVIKLRRCFLFFAFLSLGNFLIKGTNIIFGPIGDPGYRSPLAHYPLGCDV